MPKPLFDTSPQLQEFFEAFEPSLDLRLWHKLLEEELAEYDEAVATGDKVNGLKEIADVLYVMTPYLHMGSAIETVGFLPAGVAALVTPLLNRALDTIEDAREVYSDAAIEEAFNRVHKSNMSKLGDDGKPIRREDGKILKGPNYKAPDLTDLVEV